MNASELMRIVDKVVYAYKTAYGEFPDKIGINAEQRHLLPRFVIYPVPPEIEMRAWESIELEKLDSIMYRAHEIRIELVMGDGIVADEVYASPPESGDKVVSGRFIEMLAQECVPQK